VLEEIRTITTADTGEVIVAPVLLDYHLNTGWDWMDEVDDAGWGALGTWGVDGYDLGDWPYVIVAARYTRHRGRAFWGYALYCEGDVRTHWYAAKVQLWEAITREAFFYWKLNGHGPKVGWAERAEQLPIELRRPPGWVPTPPPEGQREEMGG
jgi:hypothetical protein